MAAHESPRTTGTPPGRAFADARSVAALVPAPFGTSLHITCSE
jgi:hypothetical protein